VPPDRIVTDLLCEYLETTQQPFLTRQSLLPGYKGRSAVANALGLESDMSTDEAVAKQEPLLTLLVEMIGRDYNEDALSPSVDSNPPPANGRSAIECSQAAELAGLHRQVEDLQAQLSALCGGRDVVHSADGALSEAATENLGNVRLLRAPVKARRRLHRVASPSSSFSSSGITDSDGETSDASSRAQSTKRNQRCPPRLPTRCFDPMVDRKRKEAVKALPMLDTPSVHVDYADSTRPGTMGTRF
jgi:hypothetical protein